MNLFFWKANQILESELSTSNLCGVLVKLGRFHTLMNSLGAIGNCMDRSGYSEVLETVYSKKTIPHILSGKAYDRASHESNLVLSALDIILLSKAFRITLEHANQESETASEVISYP